jgi:hypothetical protein
MLASNLITAIVGIVLIVGFLGFLGFWLKSWPLSIIMILVVGLMLYDVFKALREVKETNGS